MTSVFAFDDVPSVDHIVSSPVLYWGVHDFLSNELKRFGVEVNSWHFIRKISDIAHSQGIRFFIDNTFANPPVEMSSNYVVVSYRRPLRVSNSSFNRRFSSSSFLIRRSLDSKTTSLDCFVLSLFCLFISAISCVSFLAFSIQQ